MKDSPISSMVIFFSNLQTPQELSYRGLTLGAVGKGWGNWSGRGLEPATPSTEKLADGVLPLLPSVLRLGSCQWGTVLCPTHKVVNWSNGICPTPEILRLKFRLRLERPNFSYCCWPNCRNKIVFQLSKKVSHIFQPVSRHFLTLKYKCRTYSIRTFSNPACRTNSVSPCQWNWMVACATVALD